MFRAKLRTLVCKPPVNCSVTHKPLDNKNNGTCYDCYQFVIKRLIEIAETRINTGFFKQLDLFKLNRSGRLTGNVIHYPVHMAHLVNNSAGHDTVGKREADQRVKRIINRRKEDHARDLGDQINHGRPFAVDRRADGGQQHRHGRADGNAHDDGKRYGKINDAGRRERLQNADCGRRGLQHAGKQRTKEDAEERIGEGRQDADKGRVLAQRRNGGGHCGHTEHQDREAHQDIADVLFGRVLCRHTQNDADDRDHARERRRGEQVEPASGRADVGKTDDPARDGRTEDRAQHDGNGLPHLHHTGVDKADDHDRCGGRGLDHRRYAGAQQKALDGIAGQPVQNQLQFIARDLLQSVPHQGHAEQKQRDAAQQRDHIRNTHA